MADAPKVDCAAVVTAEDVKAACGAAVEIVAVENEGHDPKLAICERWFTEPGKPKVRLGGFFVQAGTEDAAKTWASLKKSKDAKDVAGVGDEAWTLENGGKHHVGIRKGGTLLTVDSKDKGGPCAADKLLDLSKASFGRLP